MPYYCVNRNAQQNGDHEVHDLTPGACHRLPDFSNQVPLGTFVTCHGAVDEAKRRGYWTANGCYYCCAPCHTG